jgi:hypothetical protein
LPITTNLDHYGTIIFTKNDITIIKASINSIFIIEKVKENDEIYHLVKYYKKSLSFIFEFKDKLGDNHETFTRSITHYNYEFKNQVLIKKSLNK